MLTLRFVISLRKSADPEGGKKWQSTNLNTLRFSPAVCENIEMGSVDPSHRRVKMHEP